MTNQSASAGNRSLLLFWGDVALAFFAGYAGYYLRFRLQAHLDYVLDFNLAKNVVIVAVFTGSSYLFDLYKLEIHRDRRVVANNIILASVTSFLLLTILYYSIPGLMQGRGLLAITLFIFVDLQVIWHLLFPDLFSRLMSVDKVLVVGTGVLAEKIGALVQSENFQFTHVFVGYVATPDTVAVQTVPAQHILCAVAQMQELADAHAVTHIVVATGDPRGNVRLHSDLLHCKLRGVTILDSNTFFETQTGKLLVEHMDMDWLVFSSGFKRSSLVTAAKRGVDVVLSLAGLALSLPFYPLIALLVKLDSRGPVFYSQIRVGQWDQPFRLFKFRTMKQGAEEDSGAVWSQKNDPRVSRIGSLLRKFRIDELPQLYNVLKGEMSFVGPRPERPEFVAELEREIPLYAKRHFIKPGLTGWAQVRFPYGSSVQDSYEKLCYDLYYFKNMTPVFDVVILMKTLKVVMRGSGGR